MKNLIWNLRNREGMYITEPNNYFSLLNFLVGYMFCYYKITNTNINNQFHQWLQQKMKCDFVISWGHYIYQYEANNDHMLAKRLLLDLLFEFIEEKDII